MTSRRAIQDLDAMMLEAFADEGHLADRGTYTDTQVTDVSVTVMIDRDVQRLGDMGQIIGTDNQIGLQLAEVTPRQGGTVTITADGETFRLGRRVDGDGSIEYWTVT